MDQALTLRSASHEGIYLNDNAPEYTKVISVTSGKGGVGKTNIVSNLAIALSRLGNQVMILDADLGLANIDVLLNLNCQYNLTHLLSGEVEVNDILVDGPEGIKVLPASSGMEDLINLSDEQKAALIGHLESVHHPIDYLLIDTSAGINSNVTYFNLAAHESIVVVTPEPTSITDAYALIKVLSQNYNQKRFQILINQAKHSTQAMEVYQNLTTVADRYLNVSLQYLGHLETDPKVRRAVLKQKPAILYSEDCNFSEGIKRLADKIQSQPLNLSSSGNPGFFWRQVFHTANMS